MLHPTNGLVSLLMAVRLHSFANHLGIFAPNSAIAPADPTFCTGRDLLLFSLLCGRIRPNPQSAGRYGQRRYLAGLVTSMTRQTFDHLTEIADILAAGLTRLGLRKSSRKPADFGESSLHFSPVQSGGVPPYSPEAPHD